jgi:hypothetical protein
MMMGEMGLKTWTLAILAISLFFALWAYAVANELTARNKYAPVQNFAKFKQALIFSTIYLALLSSYLYFVGADKFDEGWVLLVIILGQFILFYCFIYILIFISKSIGIIEFQKPVDFSNIAGYFFCLFFFPIGIWWVNSKIRHLLATK